MSRQRNGTLLGRQLSHCFYTTGKRAVHIGHQVVSSALPLGYLHGFWRMRTRHEGEETVGACLCSGDAGNPLRILAQSITTAENQLPQLHSSPNISVGLTIFSCLSMGLLISYMIELDEQRMLVSIFPTPYQGATCQAQIYFWR